ncbi:hypothetical protein RRG08_019618 [Elysia crispata]|uniref:Uncharacterized protein n=1 Tax=Elysia crispata TaxID=231223 RepID=A0AAE1E5P8_9GAST|nr:hypothetical protein RRG08_019618 [Elysia crispata]
MKHDHRSINRLAGQQSVLVRSSIASITTIRQIPGILCRPSTSKHLEWKHSTGIPRVRRQFSFQSDDMLEENWARVYME